jgi:hypothetical protein
LVNSQQQLRDIHRNPPRFIVAREQLGFGSSPAAIY